MKTNLDVPDPYGQWAVDTKLLRVRSHIVDFLVELTEPANKDISNSFDSMFQTNIASLRLSKSSNDVQRPNAGDQDKVREDYGHLKGPELQKHDNTWTYVTGRLREGVPPYVSLTMPDVYLESLPNSDIASKFVTVRLSVYETDTELKLPWNVVIAAVEAVLNNTRVRRVQVGQPKYRQKDLPERGYPGSGSASQGASEQRTSEADSQNPSAEVVLGLLGDAIPFAHAALRDVQQASRVVALWDQGREHNPVHTRWAKPTGFSYGAELRKDEIDKLIVQHAGDEDAIYASLESGRGVSPLRTRVSHGGMILPLMAGAQHMPVAPKWSSPDEEHLVLQRGTADAAAAAPIIGVTFPASHASDRSGRWMAVNALDGLRYILNRAEQYKTKDNKPAPIVINLSYGALAGAHDGTSMLESAIEELVSAYKGRLAVVLAAGNSHGARREADGERVDNKSLPISLPCEQHSRFKLGSGETNTLTLFVPPDKQEETYLEIWMRRTAEVGGLRLEEKELPSIEVTAPNGETLSKNGQLLRDGSAKKRPIAGLYLRAMAPQSTKRSMALVVIAPTQVHLTLPSAVAGRWTVKITNQANTEMQVDAYVERDDTSVGARRDQAARLVAHHGSSLSDEDTLSDVATGASVFRVGALQDLGGGRWRSRESRYSAEGNNQLGPELSALADQGLAMPGVRVSGSQSGMVVRANGTSLAAPQAARWIANQLAINPSVQVLRNALPQGGTARKGKKLLP